jgi:hypothetical protein
MSKTRPVILKQLSTPKRQRTLLVDPDASPDFLPPKPSRYGRYAGLSGNQIPHDRRGDGMHEQQRQTEKQLDGWLEACDLLDGAITALAGSAPPDRSGDGSWWRRELLAWCAAREEGAPSTQYIEGLEAALRSMSDADILVLLDQPSIAVRPQAA